MQNIYLDNIPSNDYNLCLTDRLKIPTAKRVVETKNTKGSRHGDRYNKYGYEDVVLTATYNYLEDDRTFKDAFSSIKQWLFNASVLRLSDENGAYHRVKNVEVDDAINEIEEYGEFDVKFTLDPFSYLPESKQTLTKPGSVFNLGNIESEPYIKIVGTGDITLSINNEQFVFKGVKDFIELDSEVMNAYKEVNGTVQNANNLMNTPYFPIFEIGENLIDWTGSVTQVEIDGRWVNI